MPLGIFSTPTTSTASCWPERRSPWRPGRGRRRPDAHPASTSTMGMPVRARAPSTRWPGGHPAVRGGAERGPDPRPAPRRGPAGVVEGAADGDDAELGGGGVAEAAERVQPDARRSRRRCSRVLVLRLERPRRRPTPAGRVGELSATEPIGWPSASAVDVGHGQPADHPEPDAVQLDDAEPERHRTLVAGRGGGDRGPGPQRAVGGGGPPLDVVGAAVGADRGRGEVMAARWWPTSRRAAMAVAVVVPARRPRRRAHGGRRTGRSSLRESAPMVRSGGPTPAHAASRSAA